MSESIRSALRPALSTLLALAVGIGGGVLIAPRTGSAVGGAGLTLSERLAMTAAPFNHFSPTANDERPVVPESRRMYFYGGRVDVRVGDGRVCTFAGRVIYRSDYHGNDAIGGFKTFSMPGGPIVLNAGTEVVPNCTLNGQPARGAWRQLYIPLAYLL